MTRHLLLALLIPATAFAQLDLRNHDDLPVVAVPAETPAEETVEPVEVWRLDCGTDSDLLIGHIRTASAATDGALLFLDDQLDQVLLVDAAGTFQRTYGRAGDGPGETRNAFDVCSLSGGRIGIAEGKPSQVFTMAGTGMFIILDANGDPLDQFRPAQQATSGEFPHLRGVRVVNDQLLVGYHLIQVSPPRFTAINRIILCDDTGAVQATLGECIVDDSLENTQGYESNEFEPYGTGRYDLARDGRIALLPERDTYLVVIRDPDGGGLRLEGQADARRRTRKEMDELVEMNTAGPFVWEACETDPALVGVRFRPDGKLWVERCPLTTEPAPRDFGTFDEFDREGKLLRRVHLRTPGDPATDHLVHLADGRFVLIRNHHVTEDSEAEDVELEVVLLE